MPPLLWNSLRGKECPPSEAHQQGALWAGSPILKQDYIVNKDGLVGKRFNEWELLEPTAVVIDTPLLCVNKNSLASEVMTPLIPAYMA